MKHPYLKEKIEGMKTTKILLVGLVTCFFVHAILREKIYNNFTPNENILVFMFCQHCIIMQIEDKFSFFLKTNDTDRQTRH